MPHWRHNGVMDLMPYVDTHRQELAVAADAGGEDARALAERLIAPLESATRLVLLSALSAAADEITRDLAPGSVDVRLRGLDPDFVVTPPPVDPSEDGFDAAPPAPASIDEGTTSRINLRLPEPLKLRIEAAAGKEGLSVNTWLVRSVAATLEPDDRGRRSGPRHPSGYTGWVR
jgi:hypothetical protein